MSKLSIPPKNKNKKDKSESERQASERCTHCFTLHTIKKGGLVIWAPEKKASQLIWDVKETDDLIFLCVHLQAFLFESKMDGLGHRDKNLISGL